MIRRVGKAKRAHQFTQPGNGGHGAMRLCPLQDLTRHCEPTGPREARPDDRLREAIHLSACGGMDCFVALLLAMTMVNQCPTTSATFSAGGVLRLRWVRTMPSMMVMLTPGRSPSCTLSRMFLPGECCALSMMTKSAERPISIRPQSSVRIRA